MTGGEHEAVAVGPLRVCRVVPHDPAEEDVRRGRERERRARVAGVRRLDGVDRQRPDRVDAEAVDVGDAELGVVCRHLLGDLVQRIAEARH